MNTDAEYLKALADELMCPNMEADLDEEDGQRICRIAEAIDKLVAERDRLMAMLRRLEFAGLDVDSEEECVCCVCGAMNWPKPQHTPGCALAALLAEKTP